ncbi:DUF2628 domain-containing protein [Uliginosibacterium gangwonense]|uniref:DUF2628 domain-containing protein n=1 Tax=Uliginosibacterium gangwonense TaxID=392736 RepID=UPI000371FD61|nr:DUF2628 domain-containing protein [Uliginosibacterium gangwonense]
MSDINPYAPPQATLESDAFQHGNTVDGAAALNAFIGPRSAYYLAKWDAMQGKNTSWNLAAFFLGAFWLVYRKMYANAFISIGILVAFHVFENILDIPASVGNIANLVMAVMIGRYGNYLYKQRATKEIQEVIQSKGLTQSALSEIAQRGGTQLGAAIGFAVLFLALGVGITFMLDPGASM